MTFEIKDGSMKTLWRVSFPMILSFLSYLGMITIDRLFLAGYSAAALGAAASAGTSAWAFTFAGQSLTNIAGVFVAHHNGAGRTEKIGQPVWQMIWLSLFFIIPFTAAGLWLCPLLFSGSPIATEQIEFYRWSMAISPLICLTGALNGFFIGRGQTKIITWLTLLANVINFILDPILIYGWGDIPSLGIAGACIATGIGLVAQVGVLFYLFLKKESRQKFGTGKFALQAKVLWSCIRVGGPESLGALLELSAWGALYILLGNLSAIHILVASVGQSLLMAVFWFGIGLEHGISSVAGNLMGAGNLAEVRRVFKSGLKIVGIFSVVLFICLAFGKDWIVDLFLKDPGDIDSVGALSTLTSAQIDEARGYLLQSLIVIGAYVSIENIRCLPGRY
jgi:MATE family multidrug resistance protein